MALGKEQHRKKQESGSKGPAPAEIPGDGTGGTVPLDQEHSMGAATSSAAVKSHVSMWQDKAGDQGQLLERNI